MGKIVILGGYGKAGREIANEALLRGHEVIRIVRSPRESTRPGITEVVGDAADSELLRRVVGEADAIVNAVAPSVDASTVEVIPAVADALSQTVTDGQRLVAIGLAANLRTDSTARVMDSPEFPPDFLPMAQAHAAALAIYEAQDDLRWTVVTPPLVFDAEGERTGTYRRGGETLLVDEEGVSRISYADFAVAVLDEIDEPSGDRRRFAVAY